MSVINESAETERVVGVFGDEPETLANDSESNDVPQNENDIESDVDSDASAQLEDDTFDISELPAAAQRRLAELEGYEHKYKSDEGRVAPLQKKIDELNHQLYALQQQGKGDSKAAQNLEEAIEQKEIDLGGLLEELPELGALVDEVKSMREELKKSRDVIQDKVIRPSQEAEAMASEEKEVKALRDAHPDLSEIVSSPRFNEWVSKQHPSIYALTQSNSAADVSAALTLYKDTNKQPSPEPEDPQGSLDDMLVLPKSGASRSPNELAGNSFEHYAKLADEGKLNKISLR
jgi:hypothetical protein